MIHPDHCYDMGDAYGPASRAAMERAREICSFDVVKDEDHELLARVASALDADQSDLMRQLDAYGAPLGDTIEERLRAWEQRERTLRWAAANVRTSVAGCQVKAHTEHGNVLNIDREIELLAKAERGEYP